MASLLPFRALHPTQENAARIAAVPYDVVSTDEARAQAADPLSFLHVSRAEIDLPPGTSPYADAVYARAKANFASLRAAAPLALDDAPTMYVYRLTHGRHTQTGVAACFAIEDYERGVIKRHELTRVDKEDDRTRHLVELRAQTGPVFLTYRASPAVAALVDAAAAAPPLFDFQAADGVTHAVWRVPAANVPRLVAAIAAVPTLYIADGHHRAASAARARRHFAGPAGTPGPWDGMLAVAFPDREMQVLPYNRTVKDLAGHSVDEFLSRVSQACAVRPGTDAPGAAGHVSMFAGDSWHDLELPPPAPGAPVADRLDVSRLHHAVLEPLLKIGDPRSDPRIGFVGGARGTADLEDRVRSRTAAVAFSMYPVSVADLMTVSDAGEIMPPKSTWFEPKLRDGLLSHLL
jgi:uncharacterized protein (DUF1015 family)